MSINNTASFLIKDYFGLPQGLPGAGENFLFDGCGEKFDAYGLSGFAHCFLKKNRLIKERYEDFFERSKRFYFENTARNALFAGEALKICSELSAKIRIMPIKGAHMILRGSYPEHGVRLMSDMDFSVDDCGLETLKSGMMQLDYEFVEDGIYGHYTFLKKRTETPVFAEFHFQPMTFKFPVNSYPYKFDNKALWSNAERSQDGIFFLNSEIHALLTCFHSIKHPKNNFFWISDITAEIKKRGINWDRMEGLVRATGSSGLFYPLVRKFQDFTGLAIPGIERFKRGSDSLTRKYFRIRADRRTGTDKTHFIATFMGVGTAEKICLLFGLLFPAEEWLVKRYGKSIFSRLKWLLYLAATTAKSFLGLPSLLFGTKRNIMK